MNIIKKALSEYGVKEVVGSKSNTRILKYFHDIGFKDTQLKDSTVWSSAFANWVAKSAGYECSGKLEPRSWLNVGTSNEEPEVGDVVILGKEKQKNTKGHVGFFIKETKSYVYILGGNQRRMVCIKAYPKCRVLDYKKLKKRNA